MARFPRLGLKSSTRVPRPPPWWAGPANARTTRLATLVLVIAVVLLGFVVPTSAAATDLQMGGLEKGVSGVVPSFEGSGGQAFKVAGSAYVAKSHAYDAISTRARNTGEHPVSADEVLATRSSESMGGGPGSVARQHHPNGMTQIGRDLDTVNASQWAPNKQPGLNSVAVHGEPAGWARPVTTGDVNAAVRTHPDFVEGQPTCLWSCHAGTNGTGQELANALNGPVIAPNGRVTVYRPDLNTEPLAEGGWSIFWPGGG